MPCNHCGACPERVVQGRTIALPVGPRLPACGHVACHGCWVEWAESQLSTCRSEARLVPFCCEEGCCAPITEGIWDLLCTWSEEVYKFNMERKEHISQLTKAVGSERFMWAPRPSDPGPMCSICCTRQIALLKNSDCTHGACVDCWVAWTEGQLPLCETRVKLRPPCSDSNCGHAIAWDTLRYLGTRSKEVASFCKSRESEVARLQPVIKNSSWATKASDDGPLCCICHERHLTLLTTPDCKHAACEHCWARWAEVHLPQCRGDRQRSVRCIGPNCVLRASPLAWNHICTISQPAREVDTALRKRDHLQQNPLYPAPMQVECPRAECLGLGYLGFDTVMCFMCEHQWTVEEGTPPEAGVGEELMAGELMKRCPSCNEHIIKNGGCDHMTCRCKYQFYWSTLKQYGVPAPLPPPPPTNNVARG